ncbi:hypothetical protein ES708_31131 [subsurface metagenome]
MIVKGDEDKMDEEKELKTWEAVSESEILKIRETIKILRKYDLGNDLRRAEGTLTKYFGIGRSEVGEEEVKKYEERCEWSTIQNQLYGYCEDDLDFVNENIEVEKSEDTKWPSLSGQFGLNRGRLEKAYEEYGLESRVV